MTGDLLIHGMHGLGDALHQRAIIRELLRRHDRLYLESSWVSVYHDFNTDRLRIIRKPMPLRTQSKNVEREAGGFWRGEVPSDLPELRIGYAPATVRSTGSVLAAMCRACMVDYRRADFRLPLPDEWPRWLNSHKPIMLYRPLTVRKEWASTAARNPDPAAYYDLVMSVRDRYHVISVADIAPDEEWIISEDIGADEEYHDGELSFEHLAGLAKSADLVFCAPGFATVLAQAVGTKCVTVFGGYESSTSFAGGARYSPWLGIDTMNPCQCWKPDHACDKRIDVPPARDAIVRFLTA